MKIVIAPDSFKESLPAAEVAAAISRGLRAVLPEATCVLVPIADGGEGTVAALVGARQGVVVERTVCGPLGEPTAIGLAHEELGVISLRLDSGEACVTRARQCADYASLAGAERAAFDALVARWGSERWAARLREERGSAAASSQRLR